MAAPHLFGNEQKYIEEAIKSNWIAPLGPFVNRLENMVSKYIGGYDCVAVATGTSALHLAVMELGITRGDIVFCSDMTFAASINPAIYEGATPVFIDSEDTTYNMSPEALKKAFKKYTPKAVILPHVYGTPADMEIIEICQNYSCPIIEDSAEALGATINGKYVGTIGNYGVFSFNGNKIITGSSGGMVVCHSEEDAQHILFKATQAKEKCDIYLHKELGYNYRMSNINAAILCGQMENIDTKIVLKKIIYDTYRSVLDGWLCMKMLPVPSDRTSNYWLSCLITDDASGKTSDKIIKKLSDANIESRHIWYPLHKEPLFSGSDIISVGKEHASTDFFNRGVCLPSDTRMTCEEQCEVIDIIMNTTV